jgi:thiol-disulfide isomerase/thioredoxin
MKELIMMRTTALSALACLGLLVGVGAAGDRKDDAYEPEARKLLEEVSQTYQGLKGYADQGVLTAEIVLGRTEGEGRQAAKTQYAAKRSVQFDRPNKLHIQIDKVEVFADGKTVTTVVPLLKRYAVAPMPDHLDAISLLKVPGPGFPAGLVFVGEGGLSIAVVVDLLCSPDPVKSVLDGTDGLHLEHDRTIKSKQYKSLLVDQTEGPDIRMTVDPKTKMVEAIELVYDRKELKSNLSRGVEVRAVSLVWLAGDIRQDPPAKTFSFEAPAGFEKVEATTGEQQARGPNRQEPDSKKPPGDDKKPEVGKAKPAEPPTPAEALVGQPAPDFSFTVLAAEGKNRTLTKADLAGKVVLIDFWATWCVPCLRELPEIQKLTESLADLKDKVAVVALSEDAEPADVTGLRLLVEKTLEEKMVKLADGPVGMVALDLEGKVGNDFKVESVPTLVLLDAKGVVRAVHLGYNPDAAELLAAQIKALVDGKPLPEPSKPADASDKD